MTFCKQLEKYLSSKGLTMPYLIAEAKTATFEEQISLTACLMSELLGRPLDDCIDLVWESVAEYDEIYFVEIEKYILEMFD